MSQRPTSRASRRRRRTAVARGVIGIVAFIALAQIIGETGIIKQNVLPLTSTVLARAAGLAGNGRFLEDLGATLEAWAVGLAITVIVAVPAGLLLGSVPVVRVATRAVVEFLRPIPSVALILLISLLLGPGLRTTTTVIVYGGVWPVLYNTMAGLDDADPVAKETLRAFGFGRLAIIRFVSLRSAAPHIATGVRIASAVALILAIGTGYVTGRINGPGIGAFIADANSGAGNTALILGAVVWTGLLGVMLNLLLVAAERLLLPWHRASLMETS